MALQKVNYVDNTTVIGATNLNDIQDELVLTQAFGTCSTDGDTATKVVTLTANNTAFVDPPEGARVTVYFDYQNTAANAKLKVGSAAAKDIYSRGAPTTGEGRDWMYGDLVTFVYSQSKWWIVGPWQPEASDDTRGLMSAEDKAKMDTLDVDSMVINFGSVSANGGTKTLTLPAGTRGVLFSIGTSSQTGIHAVICNSSGTASYIAMISTSDLSFSASGSAITITNNRSSGATFLTYVGMYASQITAS